MLGSLKLSSKEFELPAAVGTLVAQSKGQALKEARASAGLWDDGLLSIRIWWTAFRTKRPWGFNMSPKESMVTVNEQGQSVQQVLADE